MTAGTAVQQRPSGIVAILDDESARQTITPMLHEGVTYERVVREVYLAASENPEIMKCTTTSIVQAICKAVSWGLVIGETVHLVPFNVNLAKKGEPPRYEKRLKAILGFKGAIELVVRYRGARLIDAQPVYENEHFRAGQGTNPFVEHVPVMDAKARGAFIGAYAYAKLSAYEIKLVVLGLDDIKKVLARSKQWADKPLSEIGYWYGPKTAINRLVKQIPRSEALARLLAADEDLDEDGAEEVRSGTVAPEEITTGIPATAAALANPVQHPDDVLDEASPSDLDQDEPPL